VVDGVPRQHIEAATEYRLNTVDLSEQPVSEAELQVNGLVQEFLDQKIDLSTGPLFEARLWKLSDREHVLVLLIDHFVSDGVSNGILAREVWTLYDQAARGQPFSLPPLPVQFADYAVWHRQTHDAWMQKHENYWRERLKGVHRLEVPSDTGLREVGSNAGLTVHIPFRSTLSSRLRDAAGRERTPLSLVALTAYATVMSHLCRQQDLLIPFVSHGRHGRPELENVIGNVSHVLHLRIEMDRAPTFRDLLTQARRDFSPATEHQDFDRVPDFIPECMSELNFHWRSTSRARSVRDPRPVLSGQITTQPFITRLTDWPFKFWSVFYDTPAGIGVTVNYRPDCLAASTIQRFGDHLRWVADARWIVHLSGWASRALRCPRRDGASQSARSEANEKTRAAPRNATKLRCEFVHGGRWRHLYVRSHAGRV
jgi:hypothetical protein